MVMLPRLARPTVYAISRAQAQQAQAIVTPVRSGIARLGSIRLAHGEAESFEAFNARYAKFFDSVDDLFELQRGLNNCFAYDLVPSQQVVEAALKAARRVNDFSTAVRIFEGLKEKVENKGQYEEYIKATEGLRNELGLVTKEELYGLRS